MDNRRSLLILGTRMFALEVADLVAETPGLRLSGFVENWEREQCAQSIAGLPVIWVDDLPRHVNGHSAVCGLGTTKRQRFVEQVAAHVPFATVVHPTARVSQTSTLGEGTIVSVGAIIASHTKLGRHVIVNRGALIGHHAVIGDYVTIGPGANIAGATHIGAGAYIAMSATVIDRVKIGAHAVIGAGAVVTKDVPDRVQVVGVPARIVRENIDGR